MSNRRNVHAVLHGPVVSPGFNSKTGMQHAGLASEGRVYHPTKGWRKERRYPEKGYQKIARFLARAFAQ